MAVLFCCPPLSVPFWLFFTSCPVLAVKSCPGKPILPVLSCPACPVVPVLFLPVLFVQSSSSCSAYPILPILFCLSCCAYPNLPALFCLSCSAFPDSDCPLLPVLFSLSVLPVLFCLSCSTCPFPASLVLAVLSWKSRPGSSACPVLAVLFSMSCSKDAQARVGNNSRKPKDLVGKQAQ
jgi:hypothetical protein